MKIHLRLNEIEFLSYGSQRSCVMKSELFKSRKTSAKFVHFNRLSLIIHRASYRNASLNNNQSYICILLLHYSSLILETQHHIDLVHLGFFVRIPEMKSEYFD